MGHHGDSVHGTLGLACEDGGVGDVVADFGRDEGYVGAESVSGETELDKLGEPSVFSS